MAGFYAYARMLTLLPWISGLNSVTLLGRTGSAAQKRGTAENPVAVFSLATNTYHKHEEGTRIADNSQMQDRVSSVTWHNAGQDVDVTGS